MFDMFDMLVCLALISSLVAPLFAAGHERESFYRHRSPHARLHERSSSLKSVGYYPNYAIYARSFPPSSIIPTSLTHILYAFADINPTTGVVTLSDLWADQQIHYGGDSWTEAGSNLYGNLKQLYVLKQKHRNLKVLLTIGGSAYSQEGHFAFVSNANARQKFVSSAIRLLEDNGFDGLDIDFEYPTAAQKSAFVSLVSALRSALDSHATAKGDTVPYQLSLAIPASSTHRAGFDVANLNKYVTFWNLMAYDYSGSWSSVADDQANLYQGKSKSGINTHSALEWYVANGATRAKVTMGIPMYGRAFQQTNGIEKSFSGVGAGSWSDGVWDVKHLPIAGAKVSEDLSTGASYSFDAAKKELISYDTPNIVKEKAQYIKSSGMGGAMYWDITSDSLGPNSLISTSAGVLGALDQTQNHLNFPGSQFANVRACMGACVKAPAVATSSVSPCKSLKTWSAQTVYQVGNEVSYEDYVWKALQSTKDDKPATNKHGWSQGKKC